MYNVQWLVISWSGVGWVGEVGMENSLDECGSTWFRNGG